MEKNNLMTSSAKRSFITGEKWLYFKIYTGIATSDQVLLNVLLPVTSILLEKDIIQQWFFLRYADPHHHLRLRLHLSNVDRTGDAISQLQPYLSHLMQLDLVWKIQTDTYQRELERYGANSMHLAEEIFFHESEMILQYLALGPQITNENLKWLFCLRSIDDFLDVFDFSLEQKCNLMRQLKTAFGKEFGMNKQLRKQINQRYNDHRKEIADFMNHPFERTSVYKPCFDLLLQRRNKTMEAQQQILELDKTKKLGIDFSELVSSFIHMFVNRLFSDRNRLHELLYYDFLYRFYMATLSKQKINKM